MLNVLDRKFLRDNVSKPFKAEQARQFNLNQKNGRIQNLVYGNIKFATDAEVVELSRNLGFKFSDLVVTRIDDENNKSHGERKHLLNRSFINDFQDRNNISKINEVAYLVDIKFHTFTKFLYQTNKMTDNFLIQIGIVLDASYADLIDQKSKNDEMVEQSVICEEETQEDLANAQQTDTINEQIQMWIDVKESLVVGSLGIYEKRKLSELVSIKINELQGNL